jgi:2-phospho-L-lactate guanylyltransferase
VTSAVAEADTCVILPVKSFAQGKTRLRTQLSDQARATLARDLFVRALCAALQCPRVSTTYVITNGEDVASVVRITDSERHAVVLRDPEPTRPLAELMDWALAEVCARGAARALILMADLPAIEAGDLELLCTALDFHDCVLVPDRRGQSTNALGLHLPFHGRTAFGQPDSLAQHQALARALGLRAWVLANARIAHDIDVPEDLNPSKALDECAGEVARKHQGW